jgi:hypothetical protein
MQLLSSTIGSFATLFLSDRKAAVDGHGAAGHEVGLT